MPPTSSLYLAVDQRLDGRLAEILLEMRGAKFSFDDMVRELAVQHQVTVSKQTIATWCAALATDSAAAS